MGQILNITRDNSVIATEKFTEDSVSVFEYLNHTWEVDVIYGGSKTI